MVPIIWKTTSYFVPLENELACHQGAQLLQVVQKAGKLYYILQKYINYILYPFTCKSIMNLISKTHYLCGMKDYVIIVLSKYSITYILGRKRSPFWSVKLLFP